MNKNTYTVFARWADGGMEEFDFEAVSEAAARKMAQDDMDKYYEEGGEIVGVTFHPAGFCF